MTYERLLPRKAFHGWVVLPSGWRLMNNPASEGILWSHSAFRWRYMSDLLSRRAFRGWVVLTLGWRIINSTASESLLWSHSAFEVAFYEPSPASRDIDFRGKPRGERHVFVHWGVAPELFCLWGSVS
ncbi:unnamed protein product [Linum trigynum]|uniref:Uncharacterized protein n=1 Tax=Linum trigynum TaxID=586398 RepID=A0AAV2FX96_9ROSI